MGQPVQPAHSAQAEQAGSPTISNSVIIVISAAANAPQHPRRPQLLSGWALMVQDLYSMYLHNAKIRVTIIEYQ